MEPFHWMDQQTIEAWFTEDSLSDGQSEDVAADQGELSVE